MAVPVHGLPLVLHEGLDVTVVPPRLKGPRQRMVVSCSGDEAGQLVRLSGVDDLGAASELVGRTLLVAEGDLPEWFALHDVPTLIGREVRDERLGDLGTIGEVMRGPANDVWVVEGPLGEVMVPVVEAYVVELPSDGDIVVSLPASLVPDVAGGGERA